MKRQFLLLPIFIANSAFIFAQPKNDFEVKEIPRAQLAALESATKTLDEASSRLAKVQEEVSIAKKKRDAVVAEITHGAGAFESKCSDTVLGPCDNTVCSGIYSPSTRSYKRVEIRGKYALITTGSEECYAITLSNATGTANTIDFK